MPAARRLLVALGPLAVLAACASTAGTNGAVPIDDTRRADGPPATAAVTAPDSGATGDTTGAVAPTGPDPVAQAVEDVLGGQAAISRPVGDDGRAPEVTDDRVFILGDSIIESAGPTHYDTIRRELAPLGWEAIIDAQSGRTTPEGLAALSRRGRDVHDVVVVLLGHNDAIDPTAYRERIETLVSGLRDVPLVLLLTNYEFERGRDRMNDQLRVIGALHDNVELVDWNAVAGATDGAIGPDGLHLTRTGARALAATIAVSLGVAPAAAT